MKKTTLLKLLTVLLTLAALLTLFACDGNEEKPDEKPQQTVEDTVPETEPEESDPETEPAESETEPAESETMSAESETDPEDPATSPETDDAEKETDCYHPYAATQEGHWKPACDKCGKGEGRLQDHEYKEYQEDEGDLIYYSYVCDICSFEAYGQEVPYEINLFYPASELANLDASGNVEGVYHFESGIGYGRFGRDSSAAGAISKIWVEDSGSTEDESVGQYMAIKLRLPRSQTSVTLHMQSVHANKTYDLKLNDLKPGWITLMLDLGKITKTTIGQDGSEVNMGYYPDPDGEFYLKAFAVSAYVGSGESFDISYVVFCEEREDIMEFIEGEKNYYVYNDALTTPPEKHIIDCKHDYIIDEENGTHTLEEPCFICGTIAVADEPHTFVEITGNGRNSFECSVCGYAMYYKSVPIDVNKYYSASELNAGGIIYYPYSGFNHGMTVETGDAYTRYEGPINFKDKIAQVIFARDDKDQNPVNNGDAENGIRINVGDAVYFVLRVRVNTDNLNPMTVTISTTGHDGFDSKEGNALFSIPVGATPKDTWNTYVINLAEVFPTKYVPDPVTGDYIVDTYYFNLCGGTFAEGVTLDLSYMAYCSTWEEVAGLVDEEQIFFLGDSSGNGNWVSTEDRGCVGSHSPGDAKITANADGTYTYQFLCSLCGNPAATKTVDKDVSRYYYPGEISSTASTYFQLNGAASGKGAMTLYDETEEFVYSRFTGYRDSNSEAGTTVVTGQALWQRAQADMWAGQIAAPKEQYTESVGQAEWLVIRARTSNPSQAFELTYSTTMYNAEDAEAIGRTMGGMVSVKIPLSASQADEWATYVINLKNIDPASYLKDDMGTPNDPSDDEYVIDSFYIGFIEFPKSTYVDIEYMAYVEGSWPEIDALVDDEVVVVIADRAGGYGYADPATGNCLEGNHAYGYSSVTNADGSQTNKVACSVCGDQKREQTVSAQINKFFDITSVGCFNQVNASNPADNHSDAKIVGVYIEQETGTRYTRIAASFGNTHVNLNGGALGGALTSYTVDTGRYAVLKFRVDGRAFAFDAQTGDHSSHTNSMYTPTEEEEGKWQIFVIDLSAFPNEGNKGYTTNSTQTVKFRLTTSGSKRDENKWWINDPYYIDIACFAIVDDLAEAESLIGDESYRLYENGLAGAFVEKTAQ